MIRVRRAEHDADYRAWARAKRAVPPNESAWTPQQFRERATPERLVLVAVLGDEVVGAGLAQRSDIVGRAAVAPRVLPRARRLGVGTALLRTLLDHASSLGVGEASAEVDDPGSRAFAERFGFRESDRRREQVRALGAEPVVPPPLPHGIDVVTIAGRPELLGATHPLAVDGFADMAFDPPATISLGDWLADEATLPAGSFARSSTARSSPTRGSAGIQTTASRRTG